MFLRRQAAGDYRLDAKLFKACNAAVTDKCSTAEPGKEFECLVRIHGRAAWQRYWQGRPAGTGHMGTRGYRYRLSFSCPVPVACVLQVDNIPSLAWMCLAEVTRVRKDSADDYRLMVSMFRSCQTDALKFCKDVEPGHMRMQVRMRCAPRSAMGQRGPGARRCESHTDLARSRVHLCCW